MDEEQQRQGGEPTAWDGPTDPEARRPPPDDRAPREAVPSGAPSGRLEADGAEASDIETTRELPPDFYRSAGSRKPPRPLTDDGKSRSWMLAVSILLVVAIVAGVAYAGLSAMRGSPALPFVPSLGCSDGTACSAARAYLDAYTNGKYDAMYDQISAASRKRFSDPQMLRGNFSDARDYVVTRTRTILDEAHVYNIDASPGDVTQRSDTGATLPVRMVMKSSYLGTITQDLPLPLVKEGSRWRVNWSPGLIFRQLDDAQGDPQYQRKVHLFAQDAQRGTIFDRDGNVLAKDDTAYGIYVVLSKVQDQGALVSTLAQALDFTQSQVQAKLAGAKSGQNVLIRTITPQLYQRVSAKFDGLAAVQIQTSVQRIYPYGADAAAVTGYVGAVDPGDLKADTQNYYGQTDKIGKAGAEQWGERYLRPTRGGTLQIANVNADGSLGDPAYTIAQRDAANGADVHTTIAIKLQQATLASIRQRQGSRGVGVALLDPPTGDVLALVSTPIYDPNDFSLGFTPNEQGRLNAMDHPYLNRAIQSARPIGSVFKLVTLSAALESGVDPNRAFTCNGTYQVPGEDHLRKEDVGGGHGALTTLKALPPSCDVIFWQLAVEMNNHDANYLSAFAKKMGYGSASGIIGMPPGAENPGLVPDPAWLAQTQSGARWTPSDAANLGIGQGAFIATPLQVASVTAAIANNGQRMRPRLVASVTDNSGATVTSFGATVAGTIPVSAEHLAMVQAAMLGVTSDPSGTTYKRFQGFPVRVAGKTGSAEVQGQPRPDAWFTCYAPASPLSGPPVTPRLAMAVTIPGGGFGEPNAVPITIDVLGQYFNVNS
jgi:penicillin-binding protein 2